MPQRALPSVPATTDAAAFLAAVDPAVGVAVADHLAGTGRPVHGVGGMRSAAEAFARWSTLWPCTVTTKERQGLYEATAVTAPAGGPVCMAHAGPPTGGVSRGAFDRE